MYLLEQHKETCMLLFSLFKHTSCTSRTHTDSRSQQLWIPSVHGASWTVLVTDKWAVECRDRPCDCSWHWTRYKSGQRRGHRNLPDLIGRSRCHTCNSDCWSICHTAWKLSLRHEKSCGQHEGQETEEVFVQAWMCFSGLCEVRYVVVVWVNKRILESAGPLQPIRYECRLRVEFDFSYFSLK